MQTDKLFTELFHAAPELLFELLQIEPQCEYKFSSPVVKASERRMDGMWEPQKPGCPRIFGEWMGYGWKGVYWRSMHQVAIFYEQREDLLGEPFLVVVLFLDAAYDPGIETLGPLYSPNWLIRGSIPDLLRRVEKPGPLLNVLRPLIAEDVEAVRAQAPGWVEALQQVRQPEATRRMLLEILTQLVVQKFTNLTRQEIDQMLKLTPLEETAAGQELLAEGRAEGRAEGQRLGTLQFVRRSIIYRFRVEDAARLDSLLAQQSTQRLEQLAELLWEMQSIEELLSWLQEKE